MKTFFRVNSSLLPLIVFWVFAPLYPSWAVAGAFLLALAVLAIRIRRGEAAFLEKTETIVLGIFALANICGASWIVLVQVPLSYVALGAAFALTVIMGKPWTALYSATQWNEFSSTPTFKRVNEIISAVWAGFFMATGGGQFLHAPGYYFGILFFAGTIFSVLAPPVLIAIQLRKVLKKDRYAWRPEFLAQKTHTDEPDVYDAVIVGAGLGGLTTAALLAQNGLRVTVLEQHNVPGGFCHSWFRQIQTNGVRRQFRFDGGVHDVSGVWSGGPVDVLLHRLGLGDAIEWNYLDKSFFSDGLGRIDAPREWDKWVAELKHRVPDAAEDIQRFTDDVKLIFEALYFGGEERSGVPGPPTTVKAALEFGRRYPLAVQWMDRSFTEFLNERVANPDLRQHFSALTGYRTSVPTRIKVSDMVPIFGYFLYGGHYPTGGSGRLANSLVSAIERHNGTVRLKTVVAKILVEDGRVTGVLDDASRQYRSNVVVAAGDFFETVERLIDQKNWPASFRHRLGRMAPSGSAFSVHLGIKGDLTGLSPVNHIETECGGMDLIIPSLVDPTAAPHGYHCVELIRLIEQKDAAGWSTDSAEMDDKSWRRSPVYKQRKKELAAEMISLGERVISDLSQRIVFQCESSPVTFRRYSWTRSGCIYGIELSNESVEIKSPIRGLCFTGSVLLGGGVEAVMIAGARTADRLCPGILTSDKHAAHAGGTRGTTTPASELLVTS
jgi:all-trans-retinol 13,14-reductase